MEILYISSACCWKNFDTINKTAIEDLKVSINKFHNLIIEGLAKQNNIKVTSLIGLPISIHTNKKIFWKNQIDVFENIIYQQVGFINLPIIKQLTIRNNIKKHFKRWVKNVSNKEKAIVIDASYATIVPIIVKLAKKYNIKIFGIFADLYNYMCNVERSNIKQESVSIKILRKNVQESYDYMTGYIFLTENMNQKVNMTEKKYMIMEGIVSSNEIKNNIEKFNNKVIFYAGSLKREYGVEILLEAFKKLNKTKMELWICGSGELRRKIEEESQKNESIKYLGNISNSEVLEIEQKSFLLVNPRFTNKEYTKYSFPSKIMEYLLSGTPVLTTKLQGIPEEYYDYMFFIEKETIEGLEDVLLTLLELPENELLFKGKNAREFVKKEKNNIVQSKRILDFIKSIS